MNPPPIENSNTATPAEQEGRSIALNTTDKPLSPHMTGKETCKIVTPYAFTVSPDLLREPAVNELVSDLSAEQASDLFNEQAQVTVTPDLNSTGAGTEQSFSVLEWVKDVMSDSGLGLGWAALYFSVLTAWWNGQTVGKRMLGIKVVRLDGGTPNLWEIFGRYGGYGAGFVTGLLGFFQVYWDRNRQAIQDKISETLVLRVKR